jgi:hypothetical protein
MRMILGLDAPTQGSVTVGGRSYRDLPAPMREVLTAWTNLVAESCGWFMMTASGPGQVAKDMSWSTRPAGPSRCGRSSQVLGE